MINNLISKNIQFKKAVLICALITGIFLISAGSAKATLVYSSYGDSSGNYHVYSIGITEPFTTYSNSSGFWDLNQIKLDAHYFVIYSAQATISIYQDNSGSVGSLISDWDITLNNNSGDYSFGVSGVSLAADTNYWFGLEPTGSTYIDWAYTNSYGTTGATGYVFELQGDASEVPIPEPASMILLGSLATGLFGFAGLRKRFKR